MTGRSCIIGMRRDMTFDMTNTGVIADDAGKVLISAFQDDMTLMKVHMRLACVIGKVVTARSPDTDQPVRRRRRATRPPTWPS